MKQKTVRFGTQTLSVLTQKHALVPTKADNVFLPEEDLHALSLSIAHNIPSLLVGETGVGKSSVIRLIAHLRQQAYVRINMNGYTTPDELIGRIGVKNGATFFEDGILTQAMRIGAICVLDEINGTTPDCLFVLHGLLDEDKRITLPSGEIVTPHKDFRVFATCNPDYEGTKSLNKAFIDRFGIILTIHTLSELDEAKLLVKRTGVKGDVARDFVAIAQMARKDYKAHKLTFFASTRSLLQASSLVVAGLDPLHAFQVTVMRKTQNEDEQQLLRDFYGAVRKEAVVEKAAPKVKKKVVTSPKTTVGVGSSIVTPSFGGVLTTSSLEQTYQGFKTEMARAKKEVSF